MTKIYEQPRDQSTLYLNGLQIAVASNTTLTVASGAARDSTNQIDINLATGVTINAAINGVNGLDTGSLAASTVYAVFLIADAAQFNVPACLISTSATAPVLPTGYGIFRRIGWAVTDSSSHFLVLNQSGRTFFYDSPVRVLNGGAATSQTAVSLAAVCPAVANMDVLLSTSFTPNAAGHTLTLYPSGSTGTSQLISTGQVASVAITQQVRLPQKLISGVPKVDYVVANSSDAASLWVYGFVDSL